MTVKKKGKKGKKGKKPSGGSKVAKRIFETLNGLDRRVKNLERPAKKETGGPFDFLMGNDEEE